MSLFASSPTAHKYTTESIAMMIEAAEKAEDKVDEEELMTTCMTYFKAEEFDKAVPVCVQMLAAAPEKDLSMKGCATHNLASALHQLGCYEAAKPLYIDGYNKLDSADSSCFSCMDPKTAQLRFMSAKANLNEQKIKPPPLQYLDPYGKVAVWTEEEVAAAKEQVAKWSAVEPKAELDSNIVSAIGKTVAAPFVGVASLFGGGEKANAEPIV